VLRDEVLGVLAPRPGEVAVDCTLGAAGHAAELLARVAPAGKLIGMDRDAHYLPQVRDKLAAVGGAFALHHANFAALPAVLAREGLSVADLILADLGMSSMQVDDPGRGFSYRRAGPLDMRMDRGRGKTAAQILAALSEDELRRHLEELGDEPHAQMIARAIVAARAVRPVESTEELARLCLDATRSVRSAPWRLHPERGLWDTHPAARTFQVLRILVNRELDNLRALLRVLPACLAPGGRVALISFHSGEDRLIKAAFRRGQAEGIYSTAASEPIRPGPAERFSNPRARSAKLRWAHRSSLTPTKPL
jgi:16S rRNA (cytosine1402-N4)-methyltransferase